MQYWKPEDIFNVICPFCASEIEFFKDEPVRSCPSCKKEVHNPRVDPGCRKWCKYSDHCPGAPPDDPTRIARDTTGET
jgi:hypothetical protein